MSSKIFRGVTCFIYLILIALFSTTAQVVQADSNAKQESKFPYFASIKTNKVNVRKGPGTKYPIEWVYVNKNEPIEVLTKYENWYKIKDISGEGGWAHSSMISNKRFVIISGENLKNLYKSNSTDSKLIAKLKPGLRCSLKKCFDNWCKIEYGKFSGWILKEDLWGAT